MAATNLGKNTFSSDHMHDLMYLDSQANKKIESWNASEYDWI